MVGPNAGVMRRLNLLRETAVPRLGASLEPLVAYLDAFAVDLRQ